MGSIILFGACFLADIPRGESEIFFIDSSQSRIALSGKYNGMTFSAQGPGSLTATYRGNINATVSSSTIQFTGSSRISAVTNGIWQPAAGGAAGSAPADYGAEVNIPLLGVGYGAGRNIVLDMTSPVLSLTRTNFDSGRLMISAVTNANPVFDYRDLLQHGSNVLAGSFTNSVSTGSFINTNGDSLQIVIQINATLSTTNNSTLTLTGRLVATNSLSVLTAPVISGLTVTGQNLVLTVSNATVQSQLLSSTDLATWVPVSAAAATNGESIQFTIPMSGPVHYFRIEK